MMRTGGPLDKFEGGWAFIWPNMKVHFWKRDRKHEGVISYTALCGTNGLTHDRKPPLDGGEFHKCKRCKNILEKQNAESV